jgi:hypothetical protein
MLTCLKWISNCDSKEHIKGKEKQVGIDIGS